MKVKKTSGFNPLEKAPEKNSYVPPYKFKLPKSPDDPYGIICPYWADARKNIQFAYAPIKFAPPTLSWSMYKNSTGTTRQLRTPPEQS